MGANFHLFHFIYVYIIDIFKLIHIYTLFLKILMLNFEVFYTYDGV